MTAARPAMKDQFRIAALALVVVVTAGCRGMFPQPEVEYTYGTRQPYSPPNNQQAYSQPNTQQAYSPPNNQRAYLPPNNKPCHSVNSAHSEAQQQRIERERQAYRAAQAQQTQTDSALITNLGTAVQTVGDFQQGHSTTYGACLKAETSIRSVMPQSEAQAKAREDALNAISAAFGPRDPKAPLRTTYCIPNIVAPRR